MTTKAYKLLNPDLTTHGGCQWVAGETKQTSGKGDLCGPGWLHGYEHAELAHFLNPIHANFKSPILYEVRVGGQCLRDGPLKSGWTAMTLIALADVKIPTTEQRIRFGIACALSNDVSPAFRQWAYNWLDGIDRTVEAAARAAAAAWAEAAWAAEGAARARAARAGAEAAWAAWAAAWAARAGAEAAWAAEGAARAGAEAAESTMLNAARFAMSERRRP